MPRPVAGVDYPRSHAELLAMFPDDRACVGYLSRLRWPGGFVCERCGVIDDAWVTAQGLRCRHCRAHRRPLAGTILDATKTPLTTWVTAAWLVTTGKNGMSAKTLERTLGVSYHTAWAILQRFRVAMVRSERPRLSGNVEIDETLVGGVSRGGKPGRGSETRAVVVVAVELLSPKGFGRCRLRVSPSAAEADLTPVVRDLVEPGSVLLTDAWLGYDRVEQHGYTRVATNLRGNPEAAHVVHPGVHRVASLLKRWLLGTHQGAVREDHLQAYCEEFTFRFNRRHAAHRGLVFRRLLEQLVTTGPVRFDELTFGYWPPDLATPRPSEPGVIRTVVVADRPASKLPRHVDNDARFARIGRAADADAAHRQARGLGAHLVLVDGEREDDDLIRIVTEVHTHHPDCRVVVHLGLHPPATPEQLREAGAALVVKKRGPQNLLNTTANLFQEGAGA